MKLLKNAILGLSLRNGSLIIGWLSVAIAIFALAPIIGQLYKTLTNFEAEYKSMYGYLSEDRVMDEDDLRHMEYRKFSDIRDCIIGILITSASCVFSGLLLIGVYKQKPRLMIPVIAISGLGLTFVALSTFSEAFNYAGISRYVFQMIVYWFGAYYCFLVIYSHYKELMEANKSNNNLSHQILTHEQIMATDAPVKPAAENIA